MSALLRPNLHEGLPATKRKLARLRDLQAKRDIVTETAVAWFDGDATEADLREAVAALKRIKGTL